MTKEDVKTRKGTTFLGDCRCQGEEKSKKQKTNKKATRSFQEETSERGGVSHQGLTHEERTSWTQTEGWHLSLSEIQIFFGSGEHQKGI